MKQQCHCGMFFGGGWGGGWGGLAGIGGGGVQKQNGCFPLGVGPLLSPAFVHKKRKKRFQIEILDLTARCVVCN